MEASQRRQGDGVARKRLGTGWVWAGARLFGSLRHRKLTRGLISGPDLLDSGQRPFAISRENLGRGVL